MPAEFFQWHWLSLHGFVTLLAMGIFLTASHSLRQRRHPSAAIAWSLSFVLMPYLALPLYLLIGNRKQARPKSALRDPASLSVTQPAPRITSLAATLGLPPPSTCDFFELHEDGGHALRSLLSLIETATSRLDVCTFLLGRDGLGSQLASHLARAVQRGVRVRFLIDGVGRYFGGYPDLKALRAAGVSVVLFAPPLASPYAGRMNLRNHRKLAIADSQRLWTGGRNLAAEYFEGDGELPRAGAWVDLSFELHGSIAEQAQALFDSDWTFAVDAQGTTGVAQPLPIPLPHAAAAVQLVPSGPDQADDTVYTLIVSGCFSARHRIMAVSPYFVPDATLQLALTLAARRGVAVDLVVPARSNHRTADLARNAALRDLTRCGARVWLAPSMIHAKAVVFDDEFAMAGSANLDERSLFLNYELMVGFHRAEDVQRFAAWIGRQREGAQLYVARTPGVLRELREGAIRLLTFQL